MAFTAYLTYDEYKTYGGTESETAFGNLEFRAQKRIDELTDCRVQNMAEVPEEVKRCIVSLMAIEAKYGAAAQLDSPGVASFSTDGYSESYGSVTEQEAQARKAADREIRAMLYGVTDDHNVPLLFRGLNVPRRCRS